MEPKIIINFDWQAISVFSSSAIALASLMWAIYHSRKTDKINRKMIEESTRPIIGIYTDYIDTGSLVLYLIIKNFGKSIARIQSIIEDENILKLGGYFATKDRDLINDLNNSILAPNQSKIIALKYSNLIDKEITFKITYSSSSNIYEENFILNLTAGVNSPKVKSATSGKELHSISYTLQEMLQKNL